MASAAPPSPAPAPPSGSQRPPAAGRIAPAASRDTRGRDAGRGHTLIRSARLAAGVAAALYLFVLALRLLAAGAGGVTGLLDSLAMQGPLNLLGFGWLLSYGALSGSPVAALALSLLDGGVLSAVEAAGMLAGSRFGASLIVLLVGFIAYVTGRGRPDGVYVGVVAMLTTATIYAPATALSVLLVRRGTLDGVGGGIPARWGDLIGAATGPLVRPLEQHVADALLLAAGIAALLAAFWIFDRLLPSLDPPSPRVERLSRRFSTRWPMFGFGALLTAVTMSVAISVTILVPLTLKGIVRRTDVIPYIMGANITTFVDTLFAATTVSTPLAAPVVLAQVLAVTAVSVVVLVAAYRPYSSLVLAGAHATVSRRRWLVALLAGMGALPLLLLAV